MYLPYDPAPSEAAGASEPYRVTENQFLGTSLPTYGQVLKQYYYLRGCLVPEYGHARKVPTLVVVSTLLSQLKEIWSNLGISTMGDDAIKKKLKRLVGT